MLVFDYRRMIYLIALNTIPSRIIREGTGSWNLAA